MFAQIILIIAITLDLRWRTRRPLVPVVARASAHEEVMLEVSTEKRLRWLREEIMFLALSIPSFIPTFLLSVTYFHFSFFLFVLYFYVSSMFPPLFLSLFLCPSTLLFSCTLVPFWVAATYLLSCNGLWCGRSSPSFRVNVLSLSSGS
jgi:hypothetical protein